MSMRTFVFCDVCNPQGIRVVEMRRGGDRGSRWGRRITDGRAWFEGDIMAAVETQGWAIAPDGTHLCPGCAARHPDHADDSPAVAEVN